MYELENDEIEIDLKELFGVLKSKILIILATTVAFIAVSAGITRFLITPMYSSTAQLYVISNDALSQLSNLTVGTQLTQDYMAIVTTRGVVNKVIDNLDLDTELGRYRNNEKDKNASAGYVRLSPGRRSQSVKNKFSILW